MALYPFLIQFNADDCNPRNEFPDLVVVCVNDNNNDIRIGNPESQTGFVRMTIDSSNGFCSTA